MLREIAYIMWISNQVAFKNIKKYEALTSLENKNISRKLARVMEDD